LCVTPFIRANEEMPNAAGYLLDEYRAVVEEECLFAGGIPLDGRRAMSYAPKLFTDAVHPNDRGHARIARWLEAELLAYGVIEH
jgi:hypothetical protein